MVPRIIHYCWFGRGEMPELVERCIASWHTHMPEWDFLSLAKIALPYPVAFLNKPLAWYNNDVPVNLCATRNLHHPEHHMLFRLELIGDEVIRLLGDEANAPASTPYTLHQAKLIGND